jgi:hypothetical protein
LPKPFDLPALLHVARELLDERARQTPA